MLAETCATHILRDLSLGVPPSIINTRNQPTTSRQYRNPAGLQDISQEFLDLPGHPWKPIPHQEHIPEG